MHSEKEQTNECNYYNFCTSYGAGKQYFEKKTLIVLS